MFFAIRNVILWSRISSRKPRILSFKPGQVNVVTGASRTGKSALIPIIDYCLASSGCSIPEGVIRKSCEWFGIVIETESQQILLARREPGNQKQTSEMYVLQGGKIQIPDSIDYGNSTTDSVKAILHELSGLGNIGFDEESKAIGDSRISFRDVIKLSFQPQNIVANRDVLFYEASSYKHREKLRKIFPYLLGAVTTETLRKQHQLDELAKELARKLKELKAVREISLQWRAEIRTKLVTAAELGLIEVEQAQETDWSKVVKILRAIARDATVIVKMGSDNMDVAISALVELQQLENKLSRNLAKLKIRFSEMAKLKDTTNVYQDTLALQKDRLSIASWLSERLTIANTNTCITCKQPSDFAESKTGILMSALEEVEGISGNVSYAQASFDREFENVRKQVRNLTEELNAVQQQRSILEESSQKARNEQYTLQRVARFIGNIEEGLNTYEKISEDSSLSIEVAELQAQVNQLSA